MVKAKAKSHFFLYLKKFFDMIANKSPSMVSFSLDVEVIQGQREGLKYDPITRFELLLDEVFCCFQLL